MPIEKTPSQEYKDEEATKDALAQFDVWIEELLIQEIQKSLPKEKGDE